MESMHTLSKNKKTKLVKHMHTIASHTYVVGFIKYYHTRFWDLLRHYFSYFWIKQIVIAVHNNIGMSNLNEMKQDISFQKLNSILGKND